MILHIETSTDVCSVALSNQEKILFKKVDYQGMNHAALLNGFIQEALEATQSDKKALKAVSVSSGPGSYTGLRIGVSTAKGLCYGLDIPLIAVSTLEILAMPVIKQVGNERQTLFCPMIDARRMEVYDAFYQADGSMYRPVSADIITVESYKDILAGHSVYFFGNGAEKCKTELTSPHAHFIDGIVPLAENMAELAWKKYRNNDFEDVAYFEPFYLKEFQATIPKKVI